MSSPLSRKPSEPLSNSQRSSTRSPDAVVAPSTTPPASGNIDVPANMMLAGEVDIKSMRSRVYTLAMQFAQTTKLHSCISPWKYGYGYFLEFPKTRLKRIMAEEQASLEHFDFRTITRKFSEDRAEIQQTLGWWMLWQSWGILEFGRNEIIPGYHHMPDGLMKNILQQVYDPLGENRYSLMLNASGAILDRVGTPIHCMDLAMSYQCLQPRQMMKYVELLEARTLLSNYLDENGLDLWEV